MNPHAWNLTDLQAVPKNGIKVMTTFSCGGGSSMGYKRAGCDVIAANDIDPEMQHHYVLNLKPRHYYLCPIRDLLTADLPPELFKLDILDGSPPCSTFSMSGSREDAWGKDKVFREGQAKQVLSDLFFDYLDVVDRLRPKVAIAENVKGMIMGNAKGYTKLVMERFKEMGYRAQLFLVNAADCGVPQARERVFFCALREDIKAPPLVLKPSIRWVTCMDACEDVQDLSSSEVKETAPTATHRRLWGLTRPGDTYAIACEKLRGKPSLFNASRLSAAAPARTVTSCSGGLMAHWGTCRTLTLREFFRLGSFPDDYKVKSPQIGKYMVGMSVPPKMAEYVAREVCRQWLKVK